MKQHAYHIFLLLSNRVLVIDVKSRAATKIQASIFLAIIIGASVAAAYVASGYLGKSQSGPVTVVDMAGRSVSLPEKVERVIIMNTYWTEIACAVGAGSKIVGVGKDIASSVFIPEGVRNLTNVGSLFSGINLETVISLDPDVVIMDYTYGKALDIISILENKNVSVVCLTATSFQGQLNATLIIGKVLGAEEKAQQLVTYLSAEQAKITAVASSIPVASKPEVLICDLSVWGQGLVYTYVNTSWGQTVIDVGGVNMAMEEYANSSWVKISLEKILAWDPDIIIILGRDNATLTAQMSALNGTAWEQLEAVKEDKVYGMLIGAKENGCYLDWTPRMLIGEMMMAKLVNPNYYTGFDVEAVKSALSSTYYNSTL